MEGWQSVDKCPLCGGDPLAGTVKVTSDPILLLPVFEHFDLKIETEVIYCQCNTCGLYWQNPRPTDESLNEFYASGFYRKTSGRTDEAMDNGEKVRAERLIKFFAGREYKSVMDVGCSRGYFLSMLPDEVDKCGVEIDTRRPFVCDPNIIVP
jgi:hypothetical protein